MDYALFAGTALGAVALYLMLPRERAPFVKLGGLLGAITLAGLFLFLARIASHGLGTSGGDIAGGNGGPPVYFYLFAAIMIGGAVGVICQPRPVYAALYFVLVTLAGAGMFVLLMAEFMAIVLIIIYAGAILVTYVFVIMLASQGSSGGATGGAAVASIYDRRSTSGFVAVLISFLLVGAVLQVLLPTRGRDLALPAGVELRDDLMARNMGVDKVTGRDLAAPEVATTEPGGTNATVPSNVQVLGVSLYSKYSLSLELAGVLLTIALIGAVVISRKNMGIEILGTGKLPTE